MPKLQRRKKDRLLSRMLISKSALPVGIMFKYWMRAVSVNHLKMKKGTEYKECYK